MPIRRTPPPSAAGELAIWLLPNAEHESELQESIARLSVLLDSASFMPHMTVQAGITAPAEHLHAALRQMAARRRALRWTVRRVECGDDFFRCIYLRFLTLPAFGRLQRAAQRCTLTRKGLSPFPHLSLAYCAPHPDNSRLSPVLSEDWGAREIVFDRLAIVRCSRTIPARDWECVAAYPLSAS